MKKLLLLAAVISLAGCATIRNKQTDESPERKITSETTATAWFTAKQVMERLKALQTDKTQSFGLGGVTQQGATNVVAVIDAATRAIEAANPK